MLGSRPRPRSTFYICLLNLQGWREVLVVNVVWLRPQGSVCSRRRITSSRTEWRPRAISQLYGRSDLSCGFLNSWLQVPHLSPSKRMRPAKEGRGDCLESILSRSPGRVEATSFRPARHPVRISAGFSGAVNGPVAPPLRARAWLRRTLASGRARRAKALAIDRTADGSRPPWIVRERLPMTRGEQENPPAPGKAMADRTARRAETPAPLRAARDHGRGLASRSLLRGERQRIRLPERGG